MITEHPPTVIKDSTQKDIDSNEQDIQTQALEVLNAIFTTFNCQYTLLVPIIPDYKPALNQLLDSVDTTTAPKLNLVQVIKLLNNFHSYLNSFDEYMAVSEFVGCSAAMNELKTIYLELSKSKEIPTEIHMILKDEFITRFAKLKSILKQLEAKMFILKPKECVINKRITHLDHIKFHDNSVGLDDFYSCLEALDLYQDFIEKWTDTITLNWIDELLIDNQICLSKSVNCWTLRIDKVDKLSESIETHSIQNLTELAQWISTVMFTKTHRPPDHLLLNWSKKVSESLKALFVKAGDTSITPEMIQCIQAFEVCLMDFDMLFHDYFPLIDMTLFKRELKRTFHLDTLTTCRDILKSSDTNTVYVTDGTERGGLSAIMGKKYGSIASNGTGKMGQETVDKNFQFKPCHVSVHIQSVMEIIYGILNEMKPQSIHNLESWYTVRDILDLFRGITQLRKNITTAQSMVIYNDCIYVVHHLSTLGYQYQDMLPEEFKFMTLIDNVYLYYDLGKRFLTQALTSLTERIQLTLNMNVTNLDSSNLLQLEKNVTEVFHNLKSESESLKVISIRDTYLQSIGFLLNTTIKYLLEIFHGHVIDQNNCYQLYHVGSKLKMCSAFYEFHEGVGATKTIETVSIQSFVNLWSDYLRLLEFLSESNCEEFHDLLERMYLELSK